MSITSQKADVRPIAFALHDTSAGGNPAIFPLVIRPEDLTRSDTSRLVAHQTLGSAWVDAWGAGIPSITLSGHTGWGSNGRPDGLTQFEELYKTVYSKWHELRDAAIVAGKDPDKVQLIFDDALDNLTWVVAPQSFILKRNKSRPLLSTYQMSMIKLSDGVLKKPAKKTPGLSDKLPSALDSLDSAISKINDFAANIKGKIAAALGPIAAAVKTAIAFTQKLLSVVQAVKNGITSVMAPILALAKGMCQVVKNVMSVVASIKSLPQQIKAAFMSVKSAFQNIGCLLSNVFKAPATLPDYSGLYGASNCSSTSGGSPVSAYSNTNILPVVFPSKQSVVSVTPAASAAIKQVGNMDLLKPLSMTQIGAALTTINQGTGMSANAAAYVAQKSA